ncbi:MAG: universal stress protein [Candidatus Binatia bacterium]|nr:universal stress protein [Candidatus Binatia bacterium]
MQLKKILVPVDFSKDSLRAAEYARNFAAPFKAQLVLLHVIEPIYYASPADMYAASPNLALLIEEQRKAAEAQLQDLATKFANQGAKVQTLIKSGSPAQVIADTAKRIKADLIIMATHGRTGLAHALLGSVAERVVRLAPCPVLTVRRARRR